MADYDALVIGAGPTGLMMSGFLRAQGNKVCNIEMNDHVGGIASNSHHWPGYTHNTGMWFMMFAKLENMWKTLELDKYGCELIDPPIVGCVLPEKFGDPVFRMVHDPKQQIEIITEDFGKETAQQFAEFMQFLAPFAVGMEPAMNNLPMSMGALLDSVPSPEGQQAIKTLFYGTARQMVDRFLPRNGRNETLRGFIEENAVDGFFGGPMTPGSALTLAYHFGMPSQSGGGAQFKIVKGHIGNFPEAMKRSNIDKGVELRLNSEVKKFLVKDNKCYGVRLADGTEITANVVISSLDTYNTFINCMDEGLIPGWLDGAIRRINYSDHFLQMHFALNKIPSYKAPYEHLNEDLWRWNTWYLPTTHEEQWNRVKLGLMPETQTPALYIPSMLDSSLAPEGKHSMTLFNMLGFPINCPDDKYEEYKKQALDDCIKCYEKFMPDFRKCIDDVFIFGPKEYTKRYHNTGGTWTHGMIQVDQMFDHRPVKGMSDFRTPIKNLYLCGTSNHPGPGVTGNQVNICLEVMRKDKVIK